MHVSFRPTFRSVRAAAVALGVAGALLSAAVAPVGAASPGTPARPAAAPRAAMALLKSPSGNIRCIMDTSSVRCDALVHTYKPTKKPASCPGDWGTAMGVGTSGKGHFMCVFDSAYDAHDRTLAYGASKTIGRYTCTSRTTGMTCRNNRTGHGFRMAKASYTFF